MRSSQRLADQGAVASVGSKGDSYDNALAEAVNSLYKAELIGRRGPWRTAEQVELATLEWVTWWNQRRLHGAIGDIPCSTRSHLLPSAPRVQGGRIGPTVQASIRPRAVQAAVGNQVGRTCFALLDSGADYDPDHQAKRLPQRTGKQREAGGRAA